MKIVMLRKIGADEKATRALLAKAARKRRKPTLLPAAAFHQAKADDGASPMKWRSDAADLAESIEDEIDRGHPGNLRRARSSAPC
jgi:hypothetical protein